MTMLRLPVFPLGGALLFPATQLPLHIFEPRYRAMVTDALAGDGRIGMIQPRDRADPPALFSVGCIGRIVDHQELDDGRWNIVLEGETRFRVARELRAATVYRQVEADLTPYISDGDEPAPLAIASRADLERESRRYADALGYQVDWEAVGRLDDQMLVNGIAQIAPLDIGSKQALLEAMDLAARSELLVQMMQFQRLAPGGPERPDTLQ